MSWCACGDARINVWGTVLSFHHIGPGERTQITGVGSRCLCQQAISEAPLYAFGGNPGSGYRCLQTDLEYRQISVSRSISQKTDKLEVPELITRVWRQAVKSRCSSAMKSHAVLERKQGCSLPVTL